MILAVWEVYRVLRDAKAAGVGCIRVVDESGEDYLYPANRFVAVDFPKVVRASSAGIWQRAMETATRHWYEAH